MTDEPLDKPSPVEESTVAKEPAAQDTATKEVESAETVALRERLASAETDLIELKTSVKDLLAEKERNIAAKQAVVEPLTSNIVDTEAKGKRVMEALFGKNAVSDSTKL